MGVDGVQMASAVATAAALLVATLLLSHITTAPAGTLPPATGCSTFIIQFSPCLPYVSLPPNDLDSSVPPWCCTAYSSVIGSGSGACLCYLLREPSMLGFPLNNSRLASLSLDCSRLNATFVNRGSLDSLCLASPPLPPLRSSSGGSVVQLAPDTGPASIASPEASPPLDYAPSSGPAPSYAPEPADPSPDSSEDPADSSATEHFNTQTRSHRLLGSLVNALLTIIIGHL